MSDKKYRYEDTPDPYRYKFSGKCFITNCSRVDRHVHVFPACPECDAPAFSSGHFRERLLRFPPCMTCIRVSAMLGSAAAAHVWVTYEATRNMIFLSDEEIKEIVEHGKESPFVRQAIGHFGHFARWGIA